MNTETENHDNVRIIENNKDTIDVVVNTGGRRYKPRMRRGLLILL